VPGLLATDGYKFSMAEAGFALRTETFYYSHRAGGPHFLPMDVPAVVRSLLPQVVGAQGGAHDVFLAEHGYRLGGAFWAAMQGAVQVRALPAGSWFFDREPAFSVTGPSALVSWLEPLLLQLHYQVQVATLARLGRLHELPRTVTCEAQAALAEATLASVGARLPAPLRVDVEGYQAHVRGRAAELVQIVGDGRRVFEVGLRAATCLEQHRLALEACRDAGITATSNVQAAYELGLRPIGTMGHEHVQRFGDDEAAFRAMRDRHPGPASFLLDTYSTLESGLPTALRLLQEDGSRGDSVRFDSGDKAAQLRAAHARASELGVEPRYILEDGFNAALTREFEALREQIALPAARLLYGYGGYLVKAPGDPLTRDRVSAVWKLSRTAGVATMKFGDEPGSGKESIPGDPVLYRRREGAGWRRFVAQAGEAVPADAVPLYDAPPLTHDEALATAAAQGPRPAYSDGTIELVRDLFSRRAARLPGR
jgi:nicotinate phosphoribosyltransferase